MDEKEGLTYGMDRNQINVDRPWEKEIFFLGGALFLVNLDVTTLVCKSIKTISPIKRKNQPSLF